MIKISKLTFVVIVLLCAFCAGGCSKSGSSVVTHQNSDQQKVVEPPTYQVGTKFVYSDGSWERVVAVGPESVEWVNNKGHQYKSVSDFTYKRFQQKKKTRNTSRTFVHTSYLFTAPTTSLWPLVEGNETRFEEFTQKESKDGLKESDNFWRCSVKGTEQLLVTAGTFDTWKITCARYSNRWKYPSAKSREYKTWYYSPLLEHWVRQVRDFTNRKPTKTKDLVAVMPDLEEITESNDKMAQQIRDHFQMTLETRKTGDDTSWTSKKSGLTVQTYPKKVFKHSTGTFCRQYGQVFKKGADVDHYFGMACRDEEGLWKVPRG